jgi:hypothetical protein
MVRVAAPFSLDLVFLVFDVNEMERSSSESLFGLTLFGSVIVAQSYARSRWILELKSELAALSHQLMRQGYVKISSEVSSREKNQIWNTLLLPQLLLHWASYGFNPNDTSTWPQTRSAHHLTYTKEIDHLPKLISRNFYVQGIISYIIDPSFQTISFGPQTHWKLKMLVNPLWVLSDRFQPANMIELTGVDQSWHIVNIPNLCSDVCCGSPKVQGSHIDSAHDRFYATQGLPTPHDPSLWKSASDRILSMLLHQIAILFYCESPGVLGVAEGATGFYRGSHVMVIDAIKQILDRKTRNYVKWVPFYDALKEFGNSIQGFLKQEVIEEEEALLALGPLVHTSMVATSLMNGNIRTINNCKININPLLDHVEVLDIIQRIPDTSLLKQFAVEPFSVVDASERAHMQHKANELRNKILEQIKQHSSNGEVSAKSSPSRKALR